MTANEYNRGRFTSAHVAELTRRFPNALGTSAAVELFQREQGLPTDGMFGPTTRAVLELLAGREAGRAPEEATIARITLVAAPLAPLTVDVAGWLMGAGVERIAMDPSWHYARLNSDGSVPLAIVAHYSATDHGTARAMAKNRARARTDADRAASWHLSIEGDGSIVQMASCMVGTWHAGGGSAKPIPGVGPANRFSVGIELIGDGSAFPDAQVTAACRVWRALCLAYRIPRARAMVTHAELDPTRKRDPGPLWMGTYAPRVLAAAGL